MARRTLSKELITHIAKNFETRGEFRAADCSAYNAALKNGWMDDVCIHMGQGEYRTLTKAFVSSIARNFSTRKEFQRADNVAYGAAWKNGWLAEICAHMQPVRRTITKEVVAISAKKYKTRSEFQANDSVAYRAANKNGWMEDVCEHMETANYGFNPKTRAYLYQIEFTLPNGEKVWKIGITNRTPNKRLDGMGVAGNVLYTITHVISHEKGSNARNEESRLHSMGAANGMSYTGARFLGNGHTELFSAPLIA